MPHHAPTRLGYGAGLSVARRDLTRAALLWGEPADVRAAIAQATGELLAAAGRDVDLDAVADLTHTGASLRITITITITAHDPPPAPIGGITPYGMAILTSLTSRIHIRRVGRGKGCTARSEPASITIICDHFSPCLATKAETRVGGWAAASNSEITYTGSTQAG